MISQTNIAAPHPLPKGVARDSPLDFTKGTLVLFMVLYHWINYFMPQSLAVYRYLRFITPSFIVITGFIVSRVYLSKYSADDPRLRGRLLHRGAKLLLLFTILNLAVAVVFKGGEQGLRGFLSEAYSIYLNGTGQAAFDVLVPIGYFLLLSPFILLASQRCRFSLHMAGMVSLLVPIGASVAGVRSANLELISLAMFGMGVGALPTDRVNWALRRPWLLGITYSLYIAAITRWNVPFPLQVVGVSLSLLLIYLAGLTLGSEGVFQRLVIELGKYSLFAYIFHIAVLQLLRRGFRGSDLSRLELPMPLVATLCLTVLAVIVLAGTRRRSATVDRLYRAVFT